MRPSVAKIHLIDVSEPLLCYSGLTVRCGRQIERARMEAGASSQTLVGWRSEAEFFPVGTCTQCLRIGPQIPEESTKHLTYGLVDMAEERAHLEWKEAS